jgi:hypothetical protein
VAYSGIAHSAKQVEREEKRIGVGREETIASEAIGLFLEYRDKHGKTEEQARVCAIFDVLEGISAIQEIKAFEAERQREL